MGSPTEAVAHDEALERDRAADDGAKLLSMLAGRRCPSCQAATLVRDRYRGNPAVCCPACEVPQAQLW